VAGDSDFLMEIDARMNGADQALSALDQLESAIAGGKERFSELSKASAKTSSALEKVGASINEASSALLRASQVDDMKGAERAAKQLEKLVAKENSLKAAAASTSTALDKQEHELRQLATAFGDASKAAKQLEKADPPDFARKLEGIGKVAAPLSGLSMPVKDALEGFSALGVPINGLTLGAAGAALAIGALTIKLAGAAIEAGKFALNLGLAERNMGLTLQAMEGGATAGGQLRDAFSATTAATGILPDRLLDITRSLKEAGIAGADLPVALKAIAMQESALADTGGTQALIDSLKEGKVTAADLASEMDSKFGGVVEQRIKGLDQQWAIFTDRLGTFVSKLPLDALLSMLQVIGDLFDSSTASGAAMAAIFDALVPSIGDGSSAVEIFESVVLSCVEATLDLSIAWKKLKKSTGLDSTSISNMTGLSMLATMALGQLQLGLAGVSGVAEMVSSRVEALNTAWAALSGGAEDLWTDVKAAFNSAASWIGKQVSKFTALGKSIIDGLTLGLASGTAKVTNSITDAIDQGKAAAEGPEGLDAHSPSRWARDLALDTTEGFEIGHKLGAPAMNDSLLDAIGGMKRAANDSFDNMSAATGMRVRGRTSGGGGVVIQNLNVNITGADATDIDRVRAVVHEALIAELQGVSEELGYPASGEEEAA